MFSSISRVNLACHPFSRFPVPTLLCVFSTLFHPFPNIPCFSTLNSLFNFPPFPTLLVFRTFPHSSCFTPFYVRYLPFSILNRVSHFSHSSVFSTLFSLTNFTFSSLLFHIFQFFLFLNSFPALLCFPILYQ